MKATVYAVKRSTDTHTYKCELTQQGSLSCPLYFFDYHSTYVPPVQLPLQKTWLSCNKLSVIVNVAPVERSSSLSFLFLSLTLPFFFPPFFISPVSMLSLTYCSCLTTLSISSSLSLVLCHFFHPLDSERWEHVSLGVQLSLSLAVHYIIHLAGKQVDCCLIWLPMCCAKLGWFNTTTIRSDREPLRSIQLLI